MQYISILQRMKMPNRDLALLDSLCLNRLLRVFCWLSWLAASLVAELILVIHDLQGDKLMVGIFTAKWAQDAKQPEMEPLT